MTSIDLHRREGHRTGSRLGTMWRLRIDLKGIARSFNYVHTCQTPRRNQSTSCHRVASLISLDRWTIYCQSPFAFPARSDIGVLWGPTSEAIYALLKQSHSSHSLDIRQAIKKLIVILRLFSLFIAPSASPSARSTHHHTPLPRSSHSNHFKFTHTIYSLDYYFKKNDFFFLFVLLFYDFQTVEMESAQSADCFDGKLFLLISCLWFSLSSSFFAVPPPARSRFYHAQFVFCLF